MHGGINATVLTIRISPASAISRTTVCGLTMRGSPE